jgi:hypothetical protein
MAGLERDKALQVIQSEEVPGRLYEGRPGVASAHDPNRLFLPGSPMNKAYQLRLSPRLNYGFGEKAIVRPQFRTCVMLQK